MNSAQAAQAAFFEAEAKRVGDIRDYTSQASIRYGRSVLRSEFSRRERKIIEEHEAKQGCLRDTVCIRGVFYHKTRQGRLLPAIAGGSRQYFQSNDAEPVFANIALGAFTTEVGMLSAADIANYLPFGKALQPGGPQVGKIYKVYIAGSMIFAASGTMTLTPRYGTTTAGAAFGASGAQTVPASVTSPFMREGYMVVRVISTTASGSTCSYHGTMLASGTLATAGSGFNAAEGGTVATCDTTIANGFFHGIAASVSTSGTIHDAFLLSIN